MYVVRHSRFDTARAEGNQPVGPTLEPEMIFIVLALFAVTYLFFKPVLGRKLSRGETGILFIIYLATGIVVRTILFIFGM